MAGTLVALGQAGSGKQSGCPVCEDLLGRVEKEYKLAKKGDPKVDAVAKIEEIIDDVCGRAKSESDKKICYYVTPIKRKVSQPMSSFMPPDRICKKLNSESPEICTVREAVKVKIGETDYNALKVKDIKRILAERGVSCQNCIEKAEFVKKAIETEDLVRDEL